MKILKILGLIILTALAIVLIAGAFMPKEFHFKKSITIQASNEKVWDLVVNFRNHAQWSQWKELDPAMLTEITGEDGAVGAKMSWKSNHKEVGNGSQTITAVEAGKRVDTELDFGGRGKANAYWIIEGDSASCEATWGLDTKAPYPMNALMPLFNMEEMMDKMFDKGLAMLKTAAEKPE